MTEEAEIDIAEPRAFVPETEVSSLKAGLVAPMVNRNEVIGLAALGPKPSGSGGSNVR